MQDDEVDLDINFRRAVHLLETRIVDPGWLIDFWRLIPECHFPHPSIEKIR